MFVSFKNPEICRKTAILKSDLPVGPFELFADNITPETWECLDGTFYVDEGGTPFMVFCHEWTQIRDGEIAAVRLSEDLSESIGDPKVLFKASEAFWADKGATDYVTDGPFIVKSDGKLIMLWSSLAGGKYVQAVSVAEDIFGKWKHLSLLFNEDGGHGMIFQDFKGKYHLVLHYPNKASEERPVLFDAEITNEGIIIKK